MMEGKSIPLPQDLIIHKILPWLPAKSLVRFRSVCKAWNSKITTRRFVELHRERSRPRICKLATSSTDPGCVYPSLLRVERLTDDGFLECCYFRIPWLKDYSLVSSSRHLIVLSHMTGYLLSNPATEDLLHLPPASWYKPRLPYRHCTGFGFVSSLGKYKLLSITFGAQDTQICEVFTVGVDDSWRRGKSPPFRVSVTKSYCSMPCLNGNLHMLSSGSIDFAGHKDEITGVLVFNLEEETWSKKALPVVEKIGGRGTAFELREMRGFLCFVCCIPGRTTDVWMMRDYANGVWSKDFAIDGTHLGINKVLYGFPLEVMSDGRICIETTGGGWFYYDPKDGMLQLAGHQGFPNAVYAENLVPILGF